MPTPIPKNYKIIPKGPDNPHGIIAPWYATLSPECKKFIDETPVRPLVPESTEVVFVGPVKNTAPGTHGITRRK